MKALTSRFSPVVLIATLFLACVLGISFTGAWAIADESDPADDDEIDLTFTWTEDVDCSLCHSKQSSSFENEETLAGQHQADIDAAAAEEGVVLDEEDALDEEIIVSEEIVAEDDAVAEDVEEAAEEAKAEDEAVADEEATESEVVTEITCFDCHSNEDDQLVDAHEGVWITDTKGARRLINTRVTNDMCETCHDIDEVAEITADLDILTDSNGTTVNPHDLPENDSHASINCVTCHEVHEESDIDENAVQTCNNCHHMGVYECGTCHD